MYFITVGIKTNILILHNIYFDLNTHSFPLILKEIKPFSWVPKKYCQPWVLSPLCLDGKVGPGSGITVQVCRPGGKTQPRRGVPRWVVAAEPDSPLRTVHADAHRKEGHLSFRGTVSHCGLHEACSPGSVRPRGKACPVLIPRPLCPSIFTQPNRGSPNQCPQISCPQNAQNLTLQNLLVQKSSLQPG